MSTKPAAFLGILPLLFACTAGSGGTVGPLSPGGGGADPTDDSGGGETGGEETGADDSASPDTDVDSDGYEATEHGGDDCNDLDPAVNPGAEEVWYDGVDQDCSGGSDYDADGDGADAEAHGGTDCDDADPEVIEGCPEGESLLLQYAPSGLSGDIEEISANLSGVAWNPVTETLVAVLDSNRTLFELDTDLAVVREIALSNVDHSDTEDIVYVGQESDGSHTYAIVTEDNVAYLGTLPHDGSTELDLSGWRLLTFAAVPESRNSGAEGIAFDAATGTFYACKEKDPRTVWAFARPAGSGDASHADGSLVVTEPFDAETVFEGVADDVSGCTWDPRSERLLVLSHESHVLLDVDLEGTVHGSLDIDPTSTGLGKPEGVTLLTDGTLVIVGEGNSWATWTYSEGG